MTRGKSSLSCTQIGSSPFFSPYTFLPLLFPQPILGKPNCRYEESCLESEVEGSWSQQKLPGDDMLQCTRDSKFSKRPQNPPIDWHVSFPSPMRKLRALDMKWLLSGTWMLHPWPPGLPSSRPASGISHQCSRLMCLLVEHSVLVEVALLGS